MEELSYLVDQECSERLGTENFLALLSFYDKDPNKLSNIAFGNQFEELKSGFDGVEDTNIFKELIHCIATRGVREYVLKDESEYIKKVDILQKDEDDLLRILIISSKFPRMRLYYSPNLDELKKELEKYMTK